jgi:hypothetical protein
LPQSEPIELNLSAANFTRRCKDLAVPFGGILGLTTGELAFAPDMTSTTAAMSLVGRASEMIGRNRGGDHRVVPLAPVGDDVLIWTGYRERWQKSGAEHNFRFVEGGFTLHVGRPGERAKPQILRSEWVGRRSAAFVDQAGHPHWQLDVLESARGQEMAESPARFGEPSESGVALEFGSEPNATFSENLLLGLTVERIHLASAAHWWRAGTVPIAHVAETVSELDRWIMSCLGYLRQEMARCVIVSRT